jgi:hypothetical protein
MLKTIELLRHGYIYMYIANKNHCVALALADLPRKLMMHAHAEQIE